MRGAKTEKKTKPQSLDSGWDDGTVLLRAHVSEPGWLQRARVCETQRASVPGARENEGKTSHGCHCGSKQPLIPPPPVRVQAHRSRPESLYLCL